MTSHTVLVIDDDAHFQHIVTRALAQHSIATQSALSAFEAETLLRRFIVDLMVVDYWLPDATGTEFVKALTGTHSVPPFVATSVFPIPDMVEEATALGAVGVLAKPLDWSDQSQMEEFILALRSALAGRHERCPQPSKTPEITDSADRWAQIALQACKCSADPRTVSVIAKWVGISETGFADLCRMLGLQPLKARNFIRMLRIALRCSTLASAKCHLRTGDSRTLTGLIQQAGFADQDKRSSLIEQLMRSQAFIPSKSEALLAVRRRLFAARQGRPSQER